MTLLNVAQIIWKLSDQVKKNYISTRYITKEGIWKHLYPKHFVNVLLIHHMEQNKEKEIVNIASLMRDGLTGDCHLLHFSKTKCDPENSVTTHSISDIFKPFKKCDGNITIPQVIIIDGAPGMGKTTLSKEIAYQWANSQLLNDIKLVFFVYLRDPEIKKISDMQSFIHYFYNFDKSANKTAEMCADILINRSNDDVTIILDGYDEYCDTSDYLFISKIINREAFPQSKLIVTSRPTATDRLRGDIRVEVMGFTDDSKKEYIEQELKNYPDKIEKLCSYFDNDTRINSICYIPVIMTILVCTFKVTEELPSDQAELYKRFITLVISRYVEKLDFPKPKILHLENLPELYKDYMIELSKFAFETLKRNMIVFTQEDIENWCPKLSSMNNDFQGLGLLKSTQYFSMKKIDDCVSYNFLHLSIQEFLAAYYINSLNPCQQFVLLKSTLFAKNYVNTWVTFAGLSKCAMFKVYDYFIYMELLDVKLKNKLDSIDNKHDPVSIFSLLIDHYTVNHFTDRLQVFCFGDGKVIVDDKNLPSDMDDFNKLTFNRLYLSMHHVCKTPDELMEMFVVDKNTQEVLYDKVESVLKTNNQLSVAIVSVSSFTGYRATKQQICDGFKMNNRVTDSLQLTNSSIDNETAQVISRCIKNSTMTLVLFDGCIISCAGAKLILDAMSSVTSLQVVIFINMPFNELIAGEMESVIASTTKLQVLKLYNCDFHTIATRIITALTNISSLTMLDLANNYLPCDVHDGLKTVIRVNNKLQKLWLAKTNLQHHGILVTSALSEITTLTELDLTNNSMPGEVAIHLAAAINSNRSLEVLLISNNNLQSYGIITIAHPLSKLLTLKVLHIGNNKLTCEAAGAIASVILSNIQLEKLHLHDNFLGTGVREIANALKNISELKELNLNNNQIPESVSDDLAGAILSNDFLQMFTVGNNYLKTNGVKTIAQALSRKKMLRTLNLHNNQATEEASDVIGLAISSNSGLKQLYLGCNKLGTGVVKILVALSNISTLEILDLSYNNMSAEMAAKLATVLSCNFTLKDLRLNGNRLATSGITTVAKSLSNIATLKKLNVADNLITEEAVDAITSLLTSNKGLEELYIGCNEFKLGLMKLILHLKGNTSLKTLMLNNNNDDASGVLHVVEHVSEIATDNSYSLEKLSLANNNLRICALTILSSFCMVTTLLKLDLSGNYMPEEVAVALSVVISNNCSLEVRIYRTIIYRQVEQSRFQSH